MSGRLTYKIRDDYFTPLTFLRGDHAGPRRYSGAYELAHDALGVTVSKDVSSNLPQDRLLIAFWDVGSSSARKSDERYAVGREKIESNCRS